MKTLKFENPRAHIICWVLFIAYEYLIAYFIYNRLGSVLDTVIFFSLNIALFYFNAHIVFPNSEIGDKLSYPKVTLLILGEIVVYVLLRYVILFIFQALHLPILPAFTTHKIFISSAVFRGLYFIGFSTVYWLSLSTIISRKKISDLEQERLKDQLQKDSLEKALLTSENAYLRAQINPHFLLNTLNFLYNSVSKFSDDVADSVMTLADIMRYALTNAGEDGKVWLELEIEHIVNFVKLNQVRFSQRLNVDLQIEGDPEGLRIIPLILITLVENVFKYGDLLSKEYPAQILINIDGKTLIFTTQNPKKKKVVEQGHGIGVNNVKSRLAAHHSGYELTVEDNERDYKSVLTIKL